MAGRVDGDQQSFRAVPENLHADADEQEGRKAHDYAHRSSSDGARQLVRKAIADVDARRDNRGPNQNLENPENVSPAMARQVRTQSDGHGYRTRPNSQRQCQRVESAFELVLWRDIVTTRDFAFSWLIIFVIQNCPASGDHNQPASDLNYRQGNAEKSKNVRSDQAGTNQENETVQGDAPG